MRLCFLAQCSLFMLTLIAGSVCFFLLPAWSVTEGQRVSSTVENVTRNIFKEKMLDMETQLQEGVRTLRAAAKGNHVWNDAGKGLEYLALGAEKNPLVLVRVHPDDYEFVLCMASEQGEALSFKDWALSKELVMTINASMFLPDEVTSTGYMQSATHSNNERIGSRLGGFFVAEPDDPQLRPRAGIVETSEMDWERNIRQYAIRVQNYRLLTKDGNVPWDREGKRSSIAAIGQQKDSQVVFMVSVQPLTIAEFADIVRQVLPDLERAIYVEGSAKVGMFLRENDREHIWQGRKSVVFTPAPSNTVIPNVIGIVPR